MRHTLTLTTLETPDQEVPDVWEFDLEADNSLWIIFMMFGNGLFEEAAVTGSSREAIRAFIALINSGGYFREKRELRIDRRLYVEGYACFPADAPFIFVNPVALNGEISDIDDEIDESKWRESHQPNWLGRTLSCIGKAASHLGSLMEPKTSEARREYLRKKRRKIRAKKNASSPNTSDNHGIHTKHGM